MIYKQLEILWVDLNPTRGFETQKKRPCVILQSDIFNNGTYTVIVCPILLGHKDWPFVVNATPSSINGLDKNRHINLKQLRAVEVSRLSNKQGVLEANYLPDIKQKLSYIFGI